MRRLIYALLFAVLFWMGCAPSSTPRPYPAGTFTGTFRLLHKTRATGVVDTLKANVQLVLETNVGFKVLGDTSTVHAGSKGTYGVNSAGFLFLDNTYPKTGKPVKTHLNGEYQYAYDGTSQLQIVATSADTLAIIYDLKRAQ